MKKLLPIILAVAVLAGCTTRTEFGPCVGAGEDKNSALTYKLDVWNTFLGILFIETIVVPIVVVANELYCPVGKKETT